MPADARQVTPGLPPVSSPGIRTLVLGSLPSRLSVERQEYYGNPQNAFWRIAGALAGFDAGMGYEDRTAELLAAGVGLWDVLASSVRPGSLDADIDLSSARPNDLVAFLADHPGITRIGFNGRKARQLFDRYLGAALGEGFPDIELLDLPSTSPAHAAISFEQKLERWSALLINAEKKSG